MTSIGSPSLNVRFVRRPTRARGQLVHLVVVPAQPPDRDVALEDLAEADEEPGADDAVDLALERRVPAAVEEHRLEQPGEADVVRAVLDVREPALLGGRMLGRLAEILGKGSSATPSSRRSARWTTRSG